MEGRSGCVNHGNLNYQGYGRACLPKLYEHDARARLAGGAYCRSDTSHPPTTRGRASSREGIPPKRYNAPAEAERGAGRHFLGQILRVGSGPDDGYTPGVARGSAESPRRLPWNRHPRRRARLTRTHKRPRGQSSGAVSAVGVAGPARDPGTGFRFLTALPPRARVPWGWSGPPNSPRRPRPSERNARPSPRE